METHVLGFARRDALWLSLRISLSRHTRLWHITFLNLNPLCDAATKAIRTFSQRGYLLGCWMQAQSFEIFCKTLPK